jgi:hypothetical protein
MGHLSIIHKGYRLYLTVLYVIVVTNMTEHSTSDKWNWPPEDATKVDVFLFPNRPGADIAFNAMYMRAVTSDGIGNKTRGDLSKYMRGLRDYALNSRGAPDVPIPIEHPYAEHMINGLQIPDPAHEGVIADIQRGQGPIGWMPRGNQ